jgi:hypothetical protein
MRGVCGKEKNPGTNYLSEEQQRSHSSVSKAPIWGCLRKETSQFHWQITPYFSGILRIQAKAKKVYTHLKCCSFISFKEVLDY